MEYKEKLLSYEIYKTFYGEKLIEECFKNEIEEYESLFFIYSLWGYYLLDIKEVNLLIKKNIFWRTK